MKKNLFFFGLKFLVTIDPKYKKHIRELKAEHMATKNL